MQSTPTNDAPSRQRSRRPAWFRGLRNILSRWSLLIIIVCFLIFVIINISTLTNPATYTGHGSIPALDIPLLILMLTLLPLGYWAKRHAERENELLEEFEIAQAGAQAGALVQAEERAIFLSREPAHPSSFKLLQTLSELGSSISSMAWSPDGSTLALNSFEVIYLWDFKIGHTSQIAKDRRKGVRESIWESISESMAYSPDGRILAYVTSSDTIRLWSRDTQQVVQTFTLPSNSSGSNRSKAYIKHIAWSSDGQLLLVNDSLGALLLWNLETGENSRESIGWSSPDIFAWSLDGHIVAMDVTNAIELWNRVTRQFVGRFPLPDIPTSIPNGSWGRHS